MADTNEPQFWGPSRTYFSESWHLTFGNLMAGEPPRPSLEAWHLGRADTSSFVAQERWRHPDAVTLLTWLADNGVPNDDADRLVKRIEADPPGPWELRG